MRRRAGRVYCHGRAAAEWEWLCLSYPDGADECRRALLSDPYPDWPTKLHRVAKPLAACWEYEAVPDLALVRYTARLDGYPIITMVINPNNGDSVLRGYGGPKIRP